MFEYDPKSEYRVIEFSGSGFSTPILDMNKFVEQMLDGTYKNGTDKVKYQPAARYVYTLTGTTYAGDQIDMKGNVTIIR